MKDIRKAGIVRITTVIAIHIMLVAGSVIGQSDHNFPHRSSPVSRSIVGGLWRVDHTFRATIQVKNNLVKESLEVSPSLFMADGTRYRLPAQTLSPSQL